MDSYEETFETWNNIASIYQDKFMNMNLYDHTYDDFCNAVAKPNAKILEIGCGPGNITKYLLSQRPDFDIFGIDIAPNMIQLAQINNPSAQFAVMDSRQIDKIDKKYDGIIVGFCLPYLSSAECEVLISQAYRLLNEKGTLYLSFVEGNPNQSEFKVGSGGRVFFHYHDLDNLNHLLAQAKFKGVKTFNVEYKTSETTFDIHTILIAQKENAF